MANLGERDRKERESGDGRDGTRHNNSPPTKRLMLRLGWYRDGVEVGLG